MKCSKVHVHLLAYFWSCMHLSFWKKKFLITWTSLSLKAFFISLQVILYIFLPFITQITSVNTWQIKTMYCSLNHLLHLISTVIYCSIFTWLLSNWILLKCIRYEKKNSKTPFFLCFQSFVPTPESLNSSLFQFPFKVQVIKFDWSITPSFFNTM